MPLYRRTNRAALLVLALAVLVMAGCAGGSPGAGASDEQVIVDNIDLLILESFPVQVNAALSGTLFDGCVEITEITQQREGNTFTLEFQTERMIDALCQEGRVPFEETVSLEVAGLPAGTYTVEAGGASGTFELEIDNALPEE